MAELAPGAVVEIAVAGGVHGQPVGVDEVGAVHCVGPPQRLVVAEHREGDAGEGGAGKIPPSFRVHDDLPPGDGAGPGLVRVGDHAGDAVAGARGGDHEGVGALCGRRLGAAAGLGLAVARRQAPFDERGEHAIEPVEEGRALDKARDHVPAGDREQLFELHVGRVGPGVGVEAGGIGLQQGAGVGRKLGIAALGNGARVGEVEDIVERRIVLAADR